MKDGFNFPPLGDWFSVKRIETHWLVALSFISPRRIYIPFFLAFFFFFFSNFNY